MGRRTNRGARRQTSPDLFLSYSRQDRLAVTKLANELGLLGIDVWLDDWEVTPGDSLHDRIADGLSTARHVAICLGSSFVQSAWTKKEMAGAFAREDREGRSLAIPVLLGAVEVPFFLADRLHIDFTRDYLDGLFRLAAAVHGVPSVQVQRAIDTPHAYPLDDLADTRALLATVGVEPVVVLDESDFGALVWAGGTQVGDTVEFAMETVLESPEISPALRSILDELW